MSEGITTVGELRESLADHPDDRRLFVSDRPGDYPARLEVEQVENFSNPEIKRVVLAYYRDNGE